MTESTHASSLLAPFIENLYRMAWIVEARDPYTGGHLWRVSQYARMVAEDLGLEADEIARIELGGFLHDLGKVGIPDAVLNKPGPLDDHEYALIKTHPRIGARLLRGHPLATLALDAVLLHHEMPDGRGYPDGLLGDAIPLIARIVGICDAFDAMTSTRPYRKGMPVEKALDIIEQAAGKQFDAELSVRFVRLGKAGRLDHIVGHTDHGIPIMHCATCGPTIVVRQDQKPGECVYCHHCGSQALFKFRNGETIVIELTGLKGSADQLETEIDEALLSTLVASALQHLAPRYRGLVDGTH
jgi:DNA-directed RNA polymerase subunit RPC12/RpoP